MVYYVGGKFNPFTRGHYNVLKSLCLKIKDSWKNGDKILIGVTRLEDECGINGHSLCSSEEYRMEMILAVLPELRREFEFLRNENAIEVNVQNKKYTYEYLKNRIEYSHKQPITIVLGQDEAKDLEDSLNSENPKWKYAKEIRNEFSIMTILRDTIISSSAVRKIFYGNPYVEYDAVKVFLHRSVFDLIKENHHYWQYGYEDEARVEENRFLKEYDGSKFPKPSATVDLLITRNTDEGRQILLIRRKGHPYKGYWAFPGGFFDVNDDEDLEEAASRELEEETGIIYEFKPTDQFRIYSRKCVDPRGRIIDTVFTYDITKDLWGQKIQAGDDAGEFCWFDINELPRMAFNHRKIIEDYLTHCRKGFANDLS